MVARERRVLLLAAALACACSDRSGETQDSAFAGLAITHGEPTAGYGHVVELRDAATGALRCSASLIAERELLTAAHCLVEGERLPCALSGASFGRGVPVIAAAAHPGFEVLAPMGGGFVNDLALLRLGHPLGLAPNPVDASRRMAPGDAVRALGYGRTAADRTDEGVLRFGDALVTDVSANAFEIQGASQPCVFDSGGPVLARDDGRQVGVVSSGDAGCLAYARVTRLDSAASFIDDFISRRGDSPSEEDAACGAPEELRPASAGCSFSPPPGGETEWCAALLVYLLIAIRRKRDALEEET